MGGNYRQVSPGRWEEDPGIPEAFGVTWERCWRARHRNGHGQGKLRALIYGWKDARALRRLTGGWMVLIAMNLAAFPVLL